MKLFKSLLTFCLATVVVINFSACSDDDSDVTPDQNQNNNQNSNQLISQSSMVGSWNMTALNYVGSSSTTTGGTTFTSNFSGVGRDFTYVLDFADNPKIFSSSGGYTIDLTTTFSGTSFTQATSIPDVMSSGSWDLVGNTLTLIDDATNDTSITEITSSPNNDSFSFDYAGFAGQGQQNGASYNLSSGEVTFNRK